MTIDDGEIDLCTFPLFALFAPRSGMTAVVPEMDPSRPARVDPAQAFRGGRGFWRHKPVRLAGTLAAAGRGRGELGHAVADAETDHLRGRAGLGVAHRTAGSTASIRQRRSILLTARPNRCRLHRSAASEILG